MITKRIRSEFFAPISIERMVNMETIKIKIFGLFGMLGSIIAQILGGWDSALQTLLVFMAIDYITGLIVAGVFKKSNKSDSGALQSNAGWKGLCKKGVTLLIVLIGVRLDLMLGLGNFIRNAVVIGFCLNELVSIVENTGLMGIPFPPIVLQAIEVLKKKSNEVKIPKGDESHRL